MNLRNKVERIEKYLSSISPPVPPAFEDVEQLEAAKTATIHALLLAACELNNVVDPEDVAGIERALRQWASSSITDLDRAVEIVQGLLSLPKSEQAAICRHPLEVEDDAEPEDGIIEDYDIEDEHDPADCTCPKCAAARVAEGNGNGEGDGKENRGPPPGGWARPAGNYPSAF